MKEQKVTIKGKQYALVPIKAKTTKKTNKTASGLKKLESDMKKFNNSIKATSESSYTRKSDGKTVKATKVESVNGEVFMATENRYWKI